MANTPLTSRLNRAQPYVLGLFRIVVGLLFACQGAASLFGVLGREAEGAGAWPLWYAAVIELVAGSTPETFLTCLQEQALIRPWHLRP